MALSDTEQDRSAQDLWRESEFRLNTVRSSVSFSLFWKDELLCELGGMIRRGDKKTTFHRDGNYWFETKNPDRRQQGIFSAFLQTVEDRLIKEFDCQEAHFLVDLISQASFLDKNGYRLVSLVELMADGQELIEKYRLEIEQIGLKKFLQTQKNPSEDFSVFNMLFKKILQVTS